MLTVTLPSYTPSSSLLLPYIPSFHPALILLLIPLYIIAYTSHSFFTHERSRHSSISVTAADRDQSPNSAKRSRALKDFRANFGGARRGNDDDVKVEPEEERKVRELKEYEGEFPQLDRLAEEVTQAERDEMVKLKELYWKLQNLEDHPAAMEEARSKLVQLLDQTISEAQSSPSGTILSLPAYTPSSLQSFLHTAHTSAATRYEAYIARRRAGAPRHMFPTKEFAREWLKLAGVVKYVDGGWLGGVLDVASARGKGLTEGRRRDDGKLERKCGKMAWQVISEEFGDGDIEKNHVYVYERLLDELKVGAKTADGHTQPGYVRGFDGLRDDQGSPRCWTAAIAQQCIGLLASTREYFPEALGFNMAYESLPYHLLVTTRELRELRINDYYFALHVTIDNADSGHAAIARVAVEKYLDGVRERDGEEAMKMMWRRVQAGYVLAEGLPTTPSGPKEYELVGRGDGSKVWKSVKPKATTEITATETERLVANLMIRKAAAAEKMHCPSRLLISGQTIEQWLDPSKLTHDRALKFIRALAGKRPWVKEGDAAGSKLIKELEWGGRMFGAFSRGETALMRRWVQEMGQDDQRKSSEVAYAKYVGAEEVDEVEDLVEETRLSRRMKDVLPANLDDDVLSRWRAQQNSTSPTTAPEINAKSIDSLFPLWLVSTSLLEQFPLSPTKFATPLGMLVLRLLRTQLGFVDLHEREDICAGTDDVQHGEDEMVGLWELGEKIWGAEIAGEGLKHALLDLKDEGMKEMLADLLELRTRPYSNQAVLFGLTAGFASGLHGSLAIRERLGQAEQRLLDRIVVEQNQAVDEYLSSSSESWKEAGWEQDFALGQSKVYELVAAL